MLGTTIVNTSGFHPQCDGFVEKFNSTLINFDDYAEELVANLLDAWQLAHKNVRRTQAKQKAGFVHIAQCRGFVTNGSKFYHLSGKVYVSHFLLEIALWFACQGKYKARPGSSPTLTFVLSQSTPCSARGEELKINNKCSDCRG